jgi:hypothetical protein
MFSCQRCRAEDCSRWAVHNRDACRAHLDDPAAYDREIASLLTDTETIIGMNLSRSSFTIWI